VRRSGEDDPAGGVLDRAPDRTRLVWQPWPVNVAG
jgi:hypothetical protein